MAFPLRSALGIWCPPVEIPCRIAFGQVGLVLGGDLGVVCPGFDTPRTRVSAVERIGHPPGGELGLVEAHRKVAGVVGYTRILVAQQGEMRHIDIRIVGFPGRDFRPDKVMARLVDIVGCRGAVLCEFQFEGRLPVEREADHGMPLSPGVVRPVIDILVAGGEARSGNSGLDGLPARSRTVERNPVGARRDLGPPRCPLAAVHDQRRTRALRSGCTVLVGSPLHAEDPGTQIGVVTAGGGGETRRHDRSNPEERSYQISYASSSYQ